MGDLPLGADDMDSEAYTAQWILSLERAVHRALEGVGISAQSEAERFASKDLLALSLCVRDCSGRGFLPHSPYRPSCDRQIPHANSSVVFGRIDNLSPAIICVLKASQSNNSSLTSTMCAG
jgi:hypothetical protein